MTGEQLEQIFNDLTRAHARKRDNALIKAKAEIEAINREDTAYYDGVYDTIREINKALSQEAWISALIDQGYLAVVCYGWKDAAELIEDYLEER